MNLKKLYDTIQEAVKRAEAADEVKDLGEKNIPRVFIYDQNDREYTIESISQFEVIPDVEITIREVLK